VLFDSWIGSPLIVFVLQEDADARAIASWSLLGHPSMILIRTMGFPPVGIEENEHLSREIETQ
tara:strand:+ start:1913 stop:2101 length:189 start_codon:yes stop_codon:yes gene_type:complete